MISNDSGEIAANLAADAAPLAMAEVPGLPDPLGKAIPRTVGEVAVAADIPEAAAFSFLRALLPAGLIVEGTNGRRFTSCTDLANRRYDAGYLSWPLNANRPYIDHAAEFLRQTDFRSQVRRRHEQRSRQTHFPRQIAPDPRSEFARRPPRRPS